MEKRRLIRILVPYSKTIYFIDRGEQLGTAVEFGQALERQINKNKKKEIEKIRVAFVPVARDRLLPALIEGRGDIVAANLTITPSRQQIVDFTDPLASGVKEILVTGPAAPKIAAIDDLGGKEIRVRASSSYFEHLQKLNSDRRAAGQAEIGIAPIDENLEDEDLLEMVNAGLLPWCVVDGHKARIWSRVFDNIELHDDIAIAQDGEIAWAVRKNSPELMKRLNAFVKQ
ncbi:MAG: transporter substrate-binding domain-containing protein, partial [Mesorhizobium sp.]